MRALVVDDEPMVRQFICTILNRSGYETIEAQDGNEAVELAAQHQCDLVITDCLMPGLKGPQLVARLKERRYAAKFLLISAYKADEAVSDLPFLSKPFTAAQLMDAIEKLQPEAPDPAELKREMKRAKTEWRKCIEAQDEILSEIPSQLPAPDGSLLIEKAGRKRKTAYLKYMDSLHKYKASLKQPAQSKSAEPEDSSPKE
jgi:YesN/AraC family two-component response regulator